MSIVRIPGGYLLPEHVEWLRGQKLVYRYHWSYVETGFNTRNLSGGTDFIKTGVVGINLPEEFALLFKLKFSLKD